MTTATTTPRLSYTADGSTAAFTFNFEIADSSSIAVYVGSTLKTLTTDYTVSFDTGTSGTGTVTFTSAPSSGTVTLIRDTNLARTVDFQEGGAFLAATVNAEFDRLSQAVIDSTDKIEKRAILLAEPNTETATLTLPDAATRADKQLSFDSSGDIQVTSAGTGTVSNIATGTGLTGGPITTTGTIAIDSTVATLTGSQTLTNKTLTTPVISSISNTGTVTLPTATDTLVGRATTDTLTNKTINSASNTITITESNISDLGSYITASSTDTLTNKSGNISQWTNNSGYIANTVEDTTPQLGGNLDLNSNTINGTGTINITGDITGTNIRATGNLTVDGTTTTLNTQNLSIEDAFIELNRNNSSTATGTDAGIFIRNGYTGAGTDYNPTLYWDHGDQKFRFMVTDVDPNTTVNLNDGSMTLANVAMGALASGGITAAATSNFYGFNVRNNSGDNVLLFDDNNITGLRSNEDINITPAGTGTVNISSLTLASGASVTAINDEDTMSSNSATALATQQSIKAYVDGEIGGIGLDASITAGNSNVTVADTGTGSITVVADGNNVAQFTNAAGLTMSKNIAMGGNQITGLDVTGFPSADSDAATKKYVDDSVSGFSTPSSVDTFTNKTIDADGTGNNISNIDIGNMTAAVVVTAAEGIGSNNNDTTLPTSAAVKAYADSVGGISNVVEDTTPQLGGNLDLNSNNITGTGDVSITGTIANEGISISGNNIRAVRSNDDVDIKASGTGRTVIEDVFYFASDYTFNSTAGSYIQMGTDGEIVLNPNAAGNVTIGASSGSVEETIQTNNNPLWLRAGKSDNGSAIIKINGSTTTTGTEGYLYLRAGNDNEASPAHGRVEIQSTDTNTAYLQSETGKDFVITTRDNNKSLKLQAHGTGDVFLGNFRFDQDQTVGSGQDNYVLTYDNSTGKISLEASTSSFTASSTDTLTNKTFDANGTGNSISNIETADIAAATLVTAAEGIGSNNNDTTLPTSAAVKAYADSISGTITALNNQAANRLTTIGATTTELDGEANLTFDGSTLAVSGTQTITNTTTGDSLLLTTTEDTSTAAPVITLKRNSASPADGDYLGQIKFKGENDADQEVVYAKITGKTSDVTDTTEDGLIEFALQKAGSNNIGMRLTSSDLKLLNGTGLTSNGNISSEGSITATTTIGNDAITIDDNKITTSRSNDNLFVTANGTGRVNVIEPLEDSTLWGKWNGTPTRIRGLAASREDLSVDANTTGREYGHAFNLGNKLTNGSSSNSSWRPRALLSTSTVDMDGNDYTNLGKSRGPNGFNTAAVAFNSSGSSASTLNNLRGVASAAVIADFSTPSQNITVTDAISVHGGVYIEGNGTSNKVITNGYSFYSDGSVDESGSGTSAITNMYAYYAQGTAGTNNYAFYSASDTAKSRVGSLERYREEINTLTSSSTITVDCGLAPVHKVTLATNTEFNISNLGTGQSVTIIITQDGTGSRTATFGTDGSTAVKFAGGTPTLSTAASSIDVVTIFNDGTNYLGNLASAYAA